MFHLDSSRTQYVPNLRNQPISPTIRLQDSVRTNFPESPNLTYNPPSGLKYQPYKITQSHLPSAFRTQYVPTFLNQPMSQHSNV
jgi:hypothetical protein